MARQSTTMKKKGFGGLIRNPKFYWPVIAVVVLGIALLIWAIFFPPFRFITYFQTIESTVALQTAAVEHPASEVMGADFLHRASGTARFVERDGKTFVRYENLDMTNGPQLEVWLTASLDNITADYVRIGAIQGTKGGFDYEVPAGTDLQKYRFAVHWCVPFSILFNSVELSTTNMSG